MQKQTRERLSKFLHITGSKQQFIANEVGLSCVSIHLFLREERDLKQIYIDRINKLIDKVKQELVII